MTERNPPVWVQSGLYSAFDDRTVTGVLFNRPTPRDGSAWSGQAGGTVLPRTDAQATVVGTDMKVNISQGIVVVPALGSSPPGNYVCFNEGNKSLLLDIEPSTSPRMDLIVAEVLDTTVSGSEDEWQFRAIKGVPAAAPVPPAPSSTQTPIATVVVRPASQNQNRNKLNTADVRDMRQFLPAPGGVQVVWDSAGAPAPEKVLGRYDTAAGSGTAPGQRPPCTPGALMYVVDQSRLWLGVNGGGEDATPTWQEIPTKAGMDAYHRRYTRPWANEWNAEAVASDALGLQGQWTYRVCNAYAYPQELPPFDINGIVTPSGQLSIDFHCWTQVNPWNGSGVYQSALSIALCVCIYNAVTGQMTAGPDSYNTLNFPNSQGWMKDGTHFVIGGQPIDTPLTARIFFLASPAVPITGGAAMPLVRFYRPYLSVRAIL